MTPKQLDYARHNVHLAQAPSAASACKQGPYKTPSDGVASAMANAHVTESAVTKGTPSLAHTNVSSQLTQSAFHEECSPLNKSDGTAAPVTQVEVQVKTANSGSTDSYSDVTSSTPKTKKSPIPYEFLPKSKNLINTNFARQQFDVAHIWDKFLVDRDDEGQLEKYVEIMKAVFSHVHTVLSDKLLDHLKSVYSNIFMEPVRKGHNIRDIIVDVFNHVQLLKDGAPHIEDIKKVIQLTIFPFSAYTADWVRKYVIPAIEDKYKISIEYKDGKTFAHEILKGIGDGLKVTIRPTCLKLQRVVIYERMPTRLETVFGKGVDTKSIEVSVVVNKITWKGYLLYATDEEHSLLQPEGNEAILKSFVEKAGSQEEFERMCGDYFWKLMKGQHSTCGSRQLPCQSQETHLPYHQKQPSTNGIEQPLEQPPTIRDTLSQRSRNDDIKSLEEVTEENIRTILSEQLGSFRSAMILERGGTINTEEKARLTGELSTKAMQKIKQFLKTRRGAKAIPSYPQVKKAEADTAESHLRLTSSASPKKAESYSNESRAIGISLTPNIHQHAAVSKLLNHVSKGSTGGVKQTEFSDKKKRQPTKKAATKKQSNPEKKKGRRSRKNKTADKNQKIRSKTVESDLSLSGSDDESSESITRKHTRGKNEGECILRTYR